MATDRRIRALRARCPRVAAGAGARAMPRTCSPRSSMSGSCLPCLPNVRVDGAMLAGLC